MKYKSRLIIVVGCLFGFMLMLIPASLIYAAKWQFGRTVIVGTKAEEVIAQYGQPVQIFKSGELLDAWGSGRAGG
ncbi:MAG: hypothetical protein JWN70_4565 [Planctomycetaceae bacterium]|nr:hypothetical protein [Planctomycetaceae bacterium]